MAVEIWQKRLANSPKFSLDTIADFVCDLGLHAWYRIALKDSSAWGAALQNRKINLLRSALRRFPRWSWGHVALGKEAIEVGDIELAQGCVLAAQALNYDPAVCMALRGSLALRLGHPKRSIEVLQLALQTLSQSASSISSRPINRFYILEELAAAFGADGDKQSAINALNLIPTSQLSSISASTLQLLKASTQSNAAD